MDLICLLILDKKDGLLKLSSTAQRELSLHLLMQLRLAFRVMA